jgi:acyl-coenzyme A synthetase/AMP-(fatty) acid ligase
MNAPLRERISLRAAADGGAGMLCAPATEASWPSAKSGTILNGRRAELAGKSVLIFLKTQFQSALAMLELDGVASRMVVIPPDFDSVRIASVIAQADVDAVVCDDPDKDYAGALKRFAGPLARDVSTAPQAFATEWVLPTSGTTGAPKLVAHSLDGLLGAAAPHGELDTTPVWSTFYDIRRYGGLQVFLRAATVGATLVLNEADEPLADHVARMAQAGVTHVSGTPSHWRRLLMSGLADRISPQYVRLSGEIADRAILDALKTTYPASRIVHAYASTEAGVGFEVTDGQEGFPASYLDSANGVELRIVDGSLRVRSSRVARRYVGHDDLALADSEGFVDTDDLVERRGDRCLFMGRRAGTINVGGLKVHPEEVEQVINLHDAVSASLVKRRRSPITGDLIVAEVVLKEANETPERRRALSDEILRVCRARLDRHKAPVAIEFVPSIAVSPGGKVVRGKV